MVAPKCPGTEVREEYKRGFGVPTLIAVHRENDPNGDGLEIAKAYAAATGGDRAGVLESSFVAEVKSDLMGEQTILCGMLQTGSLAVLRPHGGRKGHRAGLREQARPVRLGDHHRGAQAGRHHAHAGSPEQPREDQGSSSSPRSCAPSWRPLFKKHQDDIITGVFSSTMMKDWDAGDVNLLGWRAATNDTAFEQTPLARTRSASRSTSTTRS